jgi:hypothetical protein
VDLETDGKPRDELLHRLDRADAQRWYQHSNAVAHPVADSQSDDQADDLADSESDRVTDVIADSLADGITDQFARERLYRHRGTQRPSHELKRYARHRRGQAV